MTGMKAPTAKAANDEVAATHGESSSPGARPSSSRVSVSRALSGWPMMRRARAFASSSDRPLAW